MTRALDIDALPEAVWPWIADKPGAQCFGLDSLSNQGYPAWRTSARTYRFRSRVWRWMAVITSWIWS
jgi:hypothetical protein